MNDRSEERSAEETPLDLMTVLVQTLFCGLGFATYILAPLPVIGAHFRLRDPWAKASTLGGALLAVTVFNAPMMAVAVLFVLSLFIGDYVHRGVSFAVLVRSYILLGVIVGVGLLIGGAQMAGMEILAYWQHSVDLSFKVLEGQQQIQAAELARMKDLVLSQGPFFYLFMLFLFLWISLGLAAHLKFLPENHPLRAEELRTLRLPKQFSLVFLALLLSAYLVQTVDGGFIGHLIGGVLQMTQALLFMQGCIFLSLFMNMKEVKQHFRTLIYCVAITFGFYAVVGVGVMSPWFFNRFENLGRKQT